MPSGRLIAALGIFVGLLATAVLAAPRVTAISPSVDSAHIPADAPIRIEFSRPMDRTSVETRLSITPETAGEVSWNGTALVFRPLEPWSSQRRVTVTLAPGARSTRFLPILSSREWTFTVSSSRLAYLWPANGPGDIYLLDLENDSHKRLTEAEAGVLDFTYQSSIVYASLTTSGSTQIRSLDLGTGVDDLLVECDWPVRCQSAAISPDGSTIAYERFEWVRSESGRESPGPRSVWLIAESGAPVRVTPDGQEARTPAWSPADELAFYNETLGAVQIMDSASFSIVSVIPNALGFAGTWSPDGRFLVLPELALPPQGESGPEHTRHGEQAEIISHLHKIEVPTEQTDVLSPLLVEDASPAYSPDGEWIAFGRKYLDDRWTPGRQLWVMGSDGGSARAVHYDPAADHTSIAWHPTSTSLAFMRLDQSDPQGTPEIWLTDLEGEEMRMLVEGGFLPTWIP